MIMTMDAFEAYRKYLAIKLHFKQKSYDYFKYNGQVKTTRDKFEVRNDKYFFHRLSKRPVDLDLYLATTLRDNPDVWIGDILDEKHEVSYKQAKRNLESLKYTFEKEMLQFESLDDAFVVRDGEWPKILNAYRRGQVSIETMVIVMLVAKCFPYWDANISDTIVWPRMKQTIEKYSRFIQSSVDVNKYRSIMKQLFT